MLLDTEIDWEISEEDEEAYDDCDGTETGEMKEFCENDKGKRVSTRLKGHCTQLIFLENLPYIILSIFKFQIFDN